MARQVVTASIARPDFNYVGVCRAVNRVSDRSAHGVATAEKRIP